MDTQLWGWADGDPKRSPTERLAGAVRAYERKFASLPLICYVSGETFAALNGQLPCAVQPLSGVSRSAFYFEVPQ